MGLLGGYRALGGRNAAVKVGPLWKIDVLKGLLGRKGAFGSKIYSFIEKLIF